MAFNVSNTNYWGDVVDELFSVAVTQNEVVESGCIYISDGIKKNRALPKLRMSSIIQAPAATPTPQGNFTWSEDALNPDDFLVYIEFDPNDLNDLWEQYSPTGEFLWSELPNTVKAEMLRILIEGENGVNNYMGNAILNGNKVSGVAPLNRFNGIIKKAVDDATVRDVVGWAALTVNNIMSKMDLVYETSREPIRSSPNWKILMSNTDWELYGSALRALNYKSIGPEAAAPLTYRGKKIVPLSAMPKDIMIGTVATPDRGSNLWLGVRGISDFKSIQVDKLQANSDMWFFKLKMSADTGIIWGDDLTLYSNL